MSTKSSIVYREPQPDEPGVHIYEDALAWLGSSQADVFVNLEGMIDMHFETLPGGRQSLTFRLPRKTALALGWVSGPALGAQANLRPDENDAT